MKNLVIAVFAMAAVYSCAPVKQSGIMKSAQESLAGTTWRLADKVSGKVPTINFEEGKVSGNAGCNNYFGEMDTNLSNGNMRLGNLGATKMMCDPAAMETESNFMAVLPKVNRYNISENTLELYQGKLLLLKFAKTK